MSLPLSIAVAIVAATLLVWGGIAARHRLGRRSAARRRAAALADVTSYTRATSAPYSPDPLDVRWRDDPDRDRPLLGDVPPPPRRRLPRRPRRAWPS